MATAFTEKERGIILSKLKEAAKHFAVTPGVRKTTVDDLVAEAGISKGAFYKFYESKEMLFFEILEDLHEEVYKSAKVILNTEKLLSPSERIALAILTALEKIEQNGMTNFLKDDVSYLMRKIPEETLDRHFHSDDQNIFSLIEASGIPLAQPPEIISAIIRTLVLSLVHRNQIGSYYKPAVELLVRSVCNSFVEM